MSVKGGLSQSAHVGANVAMNRQWAPSGGSKISTLAVFFVTFIIWTAVLEREVFVYLCLASQWNRKMVTN